MDQSPAKRCIAADRVLIIAHRGNSKAAPENTLPAFVAALRAGADMIELDYRHSADGVPIVLHDELLDRTTDAASVFGRRQVPIFSKSLDQLRTLDAGGWFDAQFTGTPIPTLSEALDVIQSGSVALIERKAGGAATCIELLRDKDLLDRLVVEAFDWQFLADCHRQAPRLMLAALGHGPLTEPMLDAAQATGARIVAWSADRIGSPEIDAIHARGLKAWVYTVNEPAHAARLIDASIDGIFTDQPAALKRLAGN